MKGNGVIFLIVIAFILAFCFLPAIGYIMGREKTLKCEPCVKEITKYATTTITEYATTTLIDDKCAQELQDCWYVYNQKECEDTQALKDEITSLLISRQQAKENELRLLEELNNCK